MGNNPVNFNDPSGHEPKNGEGACYEIHCKNANGTNVWDGNGKGGVVSIDNIKKQLEQYDVAVDPKLKDREVLYIFDAVISIGQSFASERGLGESGVDAFKAIYDPVTIKTGREGSGCITEGNIITCGDITYWRYESSVINIVHEFGHVFDPTMDGVWDSGSYGLPQVFVDNRDTILRDNSEIQWQANPSLTKNETFGDFFVAWVYGEWGARADEVWAEDLNAGSARNWMNTNMTNWSR